MDADTDTLSPDLRARLEDLRFVGTLSQVDANAAGARLVTTSHGAEGGRDRIDLTMLLDAEGRVVDLRYRSLATGLDLVAYDAMAQAAIGRPLAELPTITRGQALGLIDSGAGDDQAGFPVLAKIAGGSRPAPVESGGAVASELPWAEIGLFEKVRRIEHVLDEQVRPMLATDGGGIELVDLRDEELVVQYQGACGSCSSSIGGTMFFIEDTLNAALGVELKISVQGMEESNPFDL